jgi:lipid II:glycine glycyltransferase (peptidoglycan interpeptide bridge formation enzyme)
VGGSLKVVEVSDRAQWNDAVLASPHADLLQSWEWGEFKRQSGNWFPRRLAVTRDGALTAGAQVLCRPVLGAHFLYAPRGPWWNDAGSLAPLVRWLRRKEGWRSPILRADPPITTGDALRSVGFRLAPRQIQPKATIVVDIDRAPDEVLAGFSSQVRYNTRLAERKGVEVIEGGIDAVEEFWNLLSSTAHRKGFFERPLAYYTGLVHLFANNAGVFVARKDGEPVAGAIIVIFGTTAYYLYGASGGDRTVKPAELVQYHAMRWAKGQGATRYDMWGIPAHPTEDNPLYGVYRFKSGFGGREEVYVGAMDLPLMPLVTRMSAWGEVLALKARSFTRGEGFALHDHLD